MKLIDDLDLYSDLVSSIGTGTTNRILTPIECSDLIMRLKEETNESWEKLSIRLGLGKKRKINNLEKPPDTTQIRLFAKLQNLSRKNAYALGFGEVTDVKIGFTIGCFVSDLPDKNDHDILLDAVLFSKNTSKPLLKEDVKKIVLYKKKSPDIPIEKIIQKIIDYTPGVERTYVLLIDPEKEYLDIILKKNIGDDSKSYLQSLVENEFKHNEILSIKLKNNTTLQILLNEQNFKKIESDWKSKNLNVTKYFNQILKRGIENVSGK